MKHPIRRVRRCNWEREGLNAYSFDMTPDFEQQRFRLGQTVGVDELPIIEPQTSPEVVHEHRKAGHNGKYTPWSTELITTRRYETTEKRMREARTCHVCRVPCPSAHPRW